MTGEERREMTSDGDRPHARPTASMRNAECFVQVQMAHVCADVAGTAESHLRIHICTVHIDLPTVCMDDLTDASDIGFEYPVRRWVGQHQGGQAHAVFSRLCFEVCQIYVALFVTCHRHDRHP